MMLSQQVTAGQYTYRLTGESAEIVLCALPSSSHIAHTATLQLVDAHDCVSSSFQRRTCVTCTAFLGCTHLSTCDT